MTNLSEAQLRQILHIAFPELYDLAVANSLVVVALFRGEGGKMISETWENARLSLLTGENAAHIAITTPISWRLARETKGKLSCGIAADIDRPVLHHVGTGGDAWGYPRDIVTVRELKVSAVVAPGGGRLTWASDFYRSMT
jgi:hypothetical protein